MKREVRLGFEVGSGTPVDIPVRHLCVTGQTQEAGKTTTLEALIERSGLRALTFVTKRGEGAFLHARQIGPYFREQADWQFVASILEASRREKLKFERAWIIRASKGARTLADVQHNIHTALVTAKGLSADVYLTLDAYLEAVVPVIQRIQWARTVDLAAGVNVMDLSGLPLEMQHLVITSSIDWVLEHERDTVVVVPEAWQFIPQGRGTPVKLSALRYIRQGAALGNYLWLDSQDLGGVDKELLRSVPVWLLGVQREANEIKRTLSNIPASVLKPKPSEVATLELGEFLVCWGKHAHKVYVQPAWLDATSAQEVARGERDKRLRPVRDFVPMGELLKDFVGRGRRAQQAVNRVIEEEAMNAEQEKRVTERLDGVVTAVGSPATAVERLAKTPAAPMSNGPSPTARVGSKVEGDRPTVGGLEGEQFYQWLKQRLLDELPTSPQLLEVLVRQPELRVRVQRHVIEVEGDTLQGRLARLLLEGFFDEAKTSGNAHQELARRGFNTALPNVSRELADLGRMGFVTRNQKWYRAVEGTKQNIVEGP